MPGRAAIAFAVSIFQGDDADLEPDSVVGFDVFADYRATTGAGGGGGGWGVGHYLGVSPCSKRACIAFR